MADTITEAARRTRERSTGGQGKPISTKVHGAVDYSVCGMLATAPDLLGIGERAELVPRIMGVTGTAYSLLTDYEWGVYPAISMKTHLILDVASGAMLAASPWLFGFGRRRVSTWLPHLLVGAMEVAVAALSRSRRG